MKKTLVEFVQQRARYCCEYCRMPQIYDELSFEIDHIVAEQHGGKTIASNLALACFADNHHKGPNLAGIDPRLGNEPGFSIHVATNGPVTSAGTARYSLAAPLSVAQQLPFFASTSHSVFNIVLSL